MGEYSSEEQDLINQINRKKGGGFNFFDDSTLKFIHDKIVGKTFRYNDKAGNKSSQQKKINPGQKTQNQQSTGPSVNQTTDPVQAVINNDKRVRESVQNLYLSLKKLGDKDAARKLIYDHIMILNEIFKDFE